jgi:ribosomal protein S8
METSLTGKALNFGFNEYGFESHVSNLKIIDKNAYLLNHINFNLANKKLKFTIVFTQSNFRMLKIFKKLGIILNYSVNNIKNKTFLTIYLYYFKNISIFKNFKLISKPSKSFYISLKMLKLLNRRIGNSTYIISNTKGVMLHQDAIKNHLSGKIIYFIN